MSSSRVQHFDDKFAGSDDPWDYEGSWYERRKRALTLAVLPAPRYASAFEPACANGMLSAELAPRCDRLLCCDVAPRAVQLARRRLAGHSHVAVEQRDVPGQWPDGRFDLIVFSEFLYYLNTEELARLPGLARGALLRGGAMVACHWRGDDGWPTPVARIHRAFDEIGGLRRIVAYEQREFVLDVWTAD